MIFMMLFLMNLTPQYLSGWRSWQLPHHFFTSILSSSSFKRFWKESSCSH